MLEYTKSKIYPDKSLVEWSPGINHQEGRFRGKLLFRIYCDEYLNTDNVNCTLEIKNSGEWIEIKKFNEFKLWLKWIELDEHWADHHYKHLSRQACQRAAEKIAIEMNKNCLEHVAYV